MCDSFEFFSPFIGSLIAPPPWQPNKDVYNYTLSTKEPGKPPIIVTEFASNDQHEFSITHWLAAWKKSYSLAVGSKVLPFSIVVTDMSLAVSNAVLQEFSGMSMLDYLKAAVHAKESNTIKFVMLVWCYAHVLNAIVKNVKEWLPLKSKQYSPARVFVKFTMAHLARSARLDDAIEMWQLFVLVVMSKTITPSVTEALEEMSQR